MTLFSRILTGIVLVTLSTPALSGTCLQGGQIGTMVANNFVPHEGQKFYAVMATKATARKAARMLKRQTGHPRTKVFRVEDRPTGEVLGFVPVAQSKACLAL